MIRTTYIGVVCVLAIASLGIAVAGDHTDLGDRDSHARSKHTRLATVAISGTMAGCCALPDTPGPAGIPGC